LVEIEAPMAARKMLSTWIVRTVIGVE